jgi:hypothetical protein
VNETVEPAATETVVVPLPEFPPVLQRRFLSARSVTGLLLGTGLRGTKSVYVSHAVHIRVTCYSPDILKEGTLGAVRSKSLEDVLRV